MMDQYEHYISKNIKALYKRKLFAPIIYLILIVVLWFYFSLADLLFPIQISSSELGNTYRETSGAYVHTTLTNLKFTGYTQTKFGRTTGYFYYTMQDSDCIIALLSPTTCEQGLPSIDEVDVKGKICGDTSSFTELLSHLAADLNWTESGITDKVSSFYFSEPDYNPIANFALFATIFLTGGYTLVCLILYILWIFFPVLSPPCQNLALFGKPKELLEQAEEELATLPQLATEDMFITEHFFIETSNYGVAVVPINEIIWIYKYSTLHKFFWYHFSISYTLHITANKHFYIRCPKNIKSDIDGIIDYLSEANHNILVGFNEKNRLKVQEIQGRPMHYEKIIAFLQRRI